MIYKNFCGSGGMADAQVSGACGSNTMWVRLPSPAPKKKLRFCSFSKQVWKVSPFRLFFLFCDQTQLALSRAPKKCQHFLGKGTNKRMVRFLTIVKSWNEVQFVTPSQLWRGLFLSVLLFLIFSLFTFLIISDYFWNKK